jgi:signal transduction histidine kinase
VRGILHCFSDITDIRLLEQRVMNIAEHERRELGQNLHDGLGQSLTAIEYMLDSIILRLQKDHELLPQITKISDITHSFNDELHAIVKNLYPVKINKFGFSTALEEIVSEANQLTNTHCTLDYQGPDTVEPDLATHLYYITKEAVNNAIKHAHARIITITISIDGKKIEAAIWNDGLIPEKMPDKGSWHGLGIMEYRAKMINTSFEYAHHPEKGFGIHIRSRA